LVLRLGARTAFMNAEYPERRNPKLFSEVNNELFRPMTWGNGGGGTNPIGNGGPVAAAGFFFAAADDFGFLAAAALGATAGFFFAAFVPAS